MSVSASTAISRSVPSSIAFFILARRRLALTKHAPMQSASLKSAPMRSASLRSAPCNLAHLKSASPEDRPPTNWPSKVSFTKIGTTEVGAFKVGTSQVSLLTSLFGEPQLVIGKHLFLASTHLSHLRDSPWYLTYATFSEVPKCFRYLVKWFNPVTSFNDFPVLLRKPADEWGQASPNTHCTRIPRRTDQD